MKDFALRLTSRKFLLAVAACAFFAYIGQPENIKWVVSTYFAAEGAADVAERFQVGKQRVAEAEQVTAALNTGLTPPGFTQTLVAGQPNRPPTTQPPVADTQFIAGQPR